MTTVAIAALAVALLVVAVVLIRRRTPDRAPAAAAGGAVVGPTHDVVDRDGLARDAVILVPLPNKSGEGLLLGDEDALALFDASGLTVPATRGGKGPLPQLVRQAMAAGGLVSTEAAQGQVRSGRLVALSDETLEHLKKGKAVHDKAGNMLSLVKGDDKRIKHVMRLDQAGAQAAIASNAATLAVTAALGQQLEAIAQQLEAISETLDGMVRDKDRERLADAVSANQILLELADNVRRRGIAETDVHQLAALRHRVGALQLEATAKLAEVLEDDPEEMNRHERRERLQRLMERERLEYWLMLQVQADLARTRSDLLNLFWEHHAHPETAGLLNERVADAIRSRQQRAADVGAALLELTDPESRTWTDPARLLSRRRLGRAHEQMATLLGQHGDAFAGPDDDPLTVALDHNAPMAVDVGRTAQIDDVLRLAAPPART